MYTPINELNQVNSKNQSKITSKSQIFNPLVSNKYLQSKLGKLQLNKSR